MSFLVPFDLKIYKTILPDLDEYLKEDFIINGDEYTKGNIDNCIWAKYEPEEGEVYSKQFREREIKRILRN